MASLQESLTVVTCGFKNMDEVKLSLDSIRKFRNGHPRIMLVLSEFTTLEIESLEQDFSDLPLVIFQVPAEGVYKAMNYAVGKVGSGHVLFLNSGDLIESESALHTLVSSCKPNQWGYGQAVITKDKSDNNRTYRFSPYVRLFHLLGLKYIPHPSTIIPISLIRELGGFDPSYPVAADQKLLLQCSLTSKPLVLKSSVSNFKLGGISTRSSREIVRDFRKISLEILPKSHFFNWPLLNPWWIVLILRKSKGMRLRIGNR